MHVMYSCQVLSRCSQHLLPPSIYLLFLKSLEIAAFLDSAEIYLPWVDNLAGNMLAMLWQGPGPNTRRPWGNVTPSREFRGYGKV